jgi:hypothetical protein
MMLRSELQLGTVKSIRARNMKESPCVVVIEASGALYKTNYPSPRAEPAKQEGQDG